MADWDDFATPQQRQIIAYGTTHHFFTGTAVELVIKAVESEAKIHPHAMSQLKNWVDSAVSAIDERLFNHALKSRAEHIDDKLNAIIRGAINRFT